ncbi:ABC transporter substrate-binding protein [Corynebacterium neomassiliense]|uniref:ABC transporter substrate-binding protein n=1 Tax=Corynebacterium neomassiliense TaxID=2079482 RepID=UPI001386A882|nr:ABC transporter substrate-binding protein [Corynebacterium neomassiliense]
MRNPLRRLSALILGTAVAVSLAACGSEGADDIAEVSDGAAFPVTLDHAYGTERIDEKPERIVDLTYGSALEPFIALGEAPVAANSIGDLSNLPWLGNRVSWPMEEGLREDTEKVASLDPDLIIVNDIDKADWEKLENISPTLVIRTEDDKSTWHTFLPVVAAATGNKDKVEAIEKSYNDQVRSFQEEHVGVNELTYNSGAMTRGFIYAGNNVFQDIGIEMESGQKSKENGDSISDENISLLQGDILVIFDPLGKRSELEGKPAFNALPAVKNDSVIWQDKPMGFALSTAPGPLSLKWLTDKIAPQVQSAIVAHE